MFGTCRLCLKDRELRRSHIVPSWAYKRAMKLFDPDGSKVVKVTSKTRSYDCKQAREPMLCDSCEARFKAWEDEAARISLQPTAEGRFDFPALRDALPINTAPHPEVSAIVRLPGVNTDHLVRFAISVLWRAHACRLEEFREIDLGTIHGEVVRRYLLDDTTPPLPESVCVLLYLLKESVLETDKMVMPPYRGKRGKAYFAYGLSIFGLWFNMRVGGGAIDGRGLCLDRRRIATVTNGAGLGHGTARCFRSAVDVGKLAREKA